jgi:hypothetical protein
VLASTIIKLDAHEKAIREMRLAEETDHATHRWTFLHIDSIANT